VTYNQINIVCASLNHCEVAEAAELSKIPQKLTNSELLIIEKNTVVHVHIYWKYKFII